MAVSIRPASAEDSERSLELLERLTGQKPDAAAREVFAALLGVERGEVLVAEEDGTLLGVATVSYNLAIRVRGEYCQLEELIVDSEARGKNVGGLLVETLVRRARDRGCAEVGLYLLESTEHNRPFYAKYGFQPIGSEMRQGLSPARVRG